MPLQIPSSSKYIFAEVTLLCSIIKICTKPLKIEKNNGLKITRVRVPRVTPHSTSDNKMYKVLQIKKLND